jgi:uncharacterized RDD family membrane protein YckC
VFCSKCGNSLDDGVAFCPNCGTPVRGADAAAGDPQPSPVSPAPYAPPTPLVASGGYANWADRAIGYVIDSLFVAGAMLVLYVVLGGFLGSMAALGGGGSGVAGGMCCGMIVMFPIATLLVGIYNRVYLVSLRGYSIGQGVMKLKVIDANGQLLTQNNALIRLLAQVALGFIPFVGMLDLLWPLWDDRRQTLHDKAIGSFVIHNPDAR